MAGMSGGSMLRTRRKDANVKPNRRLDRKSSRGMLYENEELRLRTININAEVERGQSDIKKLKRENEQLRREVGALRGEYDRLERLLHQRQHQDSPEPENHEEDKISIISCCSDCSNDCCNLQSGNHPEIIICDSSDVTKCPTFPACHSMEIINNKQKTNEKYSKFKNDACQSGAENSQKHQTKYNCQDSTTCENQRASDNKQNTIDFNVTMDHDTEFSTDKNKIITSCDTDVHCQSETNESDKLKNHFDEISLASNCGQFCPMFGSSHNEGAEVDYPKFSGCRRLHLGLARCCGTLLSPVPEENNLPRSPLWNPENFEICNCPVTEHKDQRLNEMEDSSLRLPQDKEYYKAVVTVPLSSHIPAETNNNSINSMSAQVEDTITVFPKTGLDILMNNNCFENFQGFTATHPLGFVIPPPLNEESINSEGPFQIVPNVEFIKTNYLDDNKNVPIVDNLCSNYERNLSLNECSNSITLPSNIAAHSSRDNYSNTIKNDSGDSFIFANNGNVTSKTNCNYYPSGSSGQFLVTTCATVMSSNDNYHTNTIMTSNGLTFTSNCPIMSSMETGNFPSIMCPSTSSATNFIQNNNLSIIPSCFANIDPILIDHNDLRRNLQDSVSDKNCTTSENNTFKDSFFVCKTRKVIQQMTTVQNSNFNNMTSPCGCTCKCNKQSSEPSQEITSETISSVSNRNSRNTRFKTEKSIEVNYDYPKSHSDGMSNENNFAGNEQIKNNPDTIQTVQTTTEVNSTLYLFERKKVPTKSRNKYTNYKRSNSAPVEIPSDEPIYATVNKLPKKLKRLNIRNLENEIKYVPPEEENKEIKEENENLNEEVKVLENPDETTKDKVEIKSNGVLNKDVTISESFSESSDKNTGIPKSPVMVRKKKKFSIRFKRKYSKNNKKLGVERNVNNDHKSDDNNCQTDINKLALDITKSNSESDKLIDASSSPDSPEVKNQNHPPNFCKIHGKPKHSHQHYYKTGCESPRCYRTEYPQHRCGAMYKHGAATNEPGIAKKHLHASRSYLKQDSYQEMTTSHSERERTNSLSSSGHSGFSLGSKARSGSHSRREGSIPWCGCWGNSCL